MPAHRTDIDRVKVVIEIRYSDVRKALAISEAVSPDNIGAPQGIRVWSSARRNLFMTTIESTRELESVLSTLEDLCSCVQAAERVLSECARDSRPVHRKG